MKNKDTMNFWEVYSKGKETLKNCGVESYQFDISLIFQKCFGVNRRQLFMNKDNLVDPNKAQEFFAMVSKRTKNFPLQYILGSWEFMGFEFEVGEGALIPREDTEVLVKFSTRVLSKFLEPRIVDLCSGTGCIAISLEKFLKNNPKISAIELSEKAFEYLEKNIKKHKSKVTAINDDILVCHKNFENNSLYGIVSNPPYIPTYDIKSLQMEVKFEPKMALDGGADGLDFYKKICRLWIPKLKMGGVLAFEIGINQAEKVKHLMIYYGLKILGIEKDFGGIARVVLGTKI